MARVISGRTGITVSKNGLGALPIQRILAEQCGEASMGFIAMKALSGGLINNSRVAYTYLAQLDNVLPIWGVQRERELDEFPSYVGNPPKMADKIKALINKDRKELLGEFYGGCEYCIPYPMGIEINNCARMPLMIRRAPPAAWLTPDAQEKMKRIEQYLHCNQYRGECPYNLDTSSLLEKNLKDYLEILSEKEYQRKQTKKIEAAAKERRQRPAAITGRGSAVSNKTKILILTGINCGSG